MTPSGSTNDDWADYAARFGDRVTPGQRIVVTGGSGFIGTNLVELYRRAGATVLNIDYRPPRDSQHAECWRKVDIRDRDEYVRTVERFEPEIFLHLAAQTDFGERADLRSYDANVRGVENTLQAVERACSIRRLIVTSSQLVCRPDYRPAHDEDYAPGTLYGRSKVLTEQITRSWKRPTCAWTIVRPTGIWGPWLEEPFRSFFASIAQRLYRHPRGIDSRRSVGFVGNTAYQYVALTLAPENAVAGRMFYMSDHEALSVRKWAELIGEELGTAPIGEAPLALLKIAGRIGDALHWVGWKRLPISSRRVRNLTRDNVQNFGPLASLVGELPYTLRDGVRMTVEWLRRSGKVA